jgi:hypothetical protein
MVRKEFGKNIMSFTLINERICKLRLNGKFHNATLMLRPKRKWKKKKKWNLDNIRNPATLKQYRQKIYEKLASPNNGTNRCKT